MKKTTREKICATIFMCSLFTFAGMNAYINGGSLIEILREQMMEVSEVSQLYDVTVAVEDEITESMLVKDAFIEIYGGTQLLLDKQEFNNFSFVKDDDGFLYYGKTYNTIDTEVETYAKRVRRMSEYVEEEGKKFLFVMPLDKNISEFVSSDSVLPISDVNPTMDLFLWRLNQNMVNTLDLRSSLVETGLSYEELFFKTDHHWTTLAAFYAAVEIVEEFEVVWGDDLDIDDFYMDIENYELEILEESALGSMGKDVGILYSEGYDDMQLLTPNFETDYSYTYYNSSGKEILRTGTFEETLMFTEYLDGSYENTERVYLNTANREDIIINNLNPDGPKLLVLRDSYFSPVAAFLSPLFSEIHMVWATSQENPGVDFEEFLKENIDEYDYVILEVYSHNLNDYSFEFFQ